MKYIKVLIIAVLVFNSIYSTAQEVDKCILIDSILSINQIVAHLQLDKKKFRRIRIFDPKNFFEDSICTLSSHHRVSFIDKIPLDFNTGRYVDLAIIGIEKEANMLYVSVFYTLSGQSDDYANLWAGDITMEIIDNNVFSIINLNFYNLD